MTLAVGEQKLPLVLLCLDAGDPRFIQQWAGEGRLPVIKSIMDRGCWGTTAGPELISEHGVWASVLSGISRSQHGFYFFRQLKPGTYELETVTGHQFDAPPFWSHLKGGDRKVAIVDIGEEDPIPGLRGIQLSNWDTHHNWNPARYVTASEPPKFLREVQRQFGTKLSVMESHQSTLGEDREIHRQLLANIEKKGAMCRWLLGRDQFDLVTLMFCESHSASHQFWKYRPEAPAEMRVEASDLTHAIRDVYEAIDRELGLLLNELPGESNIFILSSVGLDDCYPASELIDSFCRQLGYQTTPASKVGSFRPIDLARIILPESWRIALSRRLSRDRREGIVADQFRTGTDWGKTTAFSIPSFYTSLVRINLCGREPEGIVKPGEEYDRVLDRLEADLKQLTDAETGEPAVDAVFRTTASFGCGPHDHLPDLFVAWKPGRFMSRVLHPRAELTQRKPEFFRPSDHCRYGFVAAAGPSIGGKGSLGELSLLDLALTFMSLMGEPIPARMRGRVVPAFCQD